MIGDHFGMYLVLIPHYRIEILAKECKSALSTVLALGTVLYQPMPAAWYLVVMVTRHGIFSSTPPINMHRTWLRWGGEIGEALSLQPSPARAGHKDQSRSQFLKSYPGGLHELAFLVKLQKCIDTLTRCSLHLRRAQIYALIIAHTSSLLLTEKLHLHSNSPYPGSLGPGTVRNSEMPVTKNFI